MEVVNNHALHLWSYILWVFSLKRWCFYTNQPVFPFLTLEGMGEGINLTDYQKHWHNRSLFVKTSIDPN